MSSLLDNCCLVESLLVLNKFKQYSSIDTSFSFDNSSTDDIHNLHNKRFIETIDGTFNFNK